jgi:hypothetical protein
MSNLFSFERTYNLYWVDGKWERPPPIAYYGKPWMGGAYGDAPVMKPFDYRELESERMKRIKQINEAGGGL